MPNLDYASLSNKNLYLLGVDIGGTNVKYGLISRRGEVIISGESNVSFDHYQTPVIDTVLCSISRFLSGSRTLQAVQRKYGQTEVKPLGACISTTGQIDIKRGFVVGTCGNLPGWPETALKDIFEQNFNLPTVVANDANCMILGEAWKGAAEGFDNVVGITLGTGLGGGIILGGQLFSGTRGMSGEIGHMPLYAWGAECTCGLKGCAEQYISVTALHRRAQEVGHSFSSARKLSNDIRKGYASPELIQTFNAWVNDIALFLVGMVHTFNPQLIIIGGGISQQEELLISPVREKVSSMIMPSFQGSVDILAAKLGNRAGMIGAAKFWLDQAAEGYFPALV